MPRPLATAAAAIVAALACAVAQSPIVLGQPLNSPNQGNVGGGVYFDMTVLSTITLTSITYVASDVSPAGQSACNVYVGPAQWQNNVTSPNVWVLVGTTVPVPITGGVDQSVVGVLQPAGLNSGPLAFAPGNWGVALQAVGHSFGYQNLAASFSTAELIVTTGSASNVFLTAPTFMPRTFNGEIAYTLGGTPFSVASSTQYGHGCYGAFQSFYESFPVPNAAFDVAQKAVRMVYNQGTNSYSVSVAAAAPLSTVGTALPFAGINANTTVQLQNAQPILWAGASGPAMSPVDPVTGNFVCDVSVDGFVSFVPGSNPPPVALHDPTVAGLLAGGARFGNWHDMDLTGGGSIRYGFDPALSAHVFTWDAVPSRANQGTNRFQILAYANGDLELRFGVMALPGLGSPMLVGYSPGGGAVDPDNRDLTGGAFVTDTADLQPLTLAAGALPVLGTTVPLVTSAVTSQPGVGALFLSSSAFQPPLPLVILGAPDCFALVQSLDIGFVIDNTTVNGLTVPLPIPNLPGLVQFAFFAQSVWLDATQNAFGIVTSNGLRLIIG